MNWWYRGQDPTRGWRREESQLAVDVGQCTLVGVSLGEPRELLSPLGPSENARQAVRGYPVWYSLGLRATIEQGRVADFSVSLANDKSFRSFPGRILCNGAATALSKKTTLDEAAKMLGEPFGISNNDWDTATVAFYETALGEAQFAFGKESGTLESLEFWYEPELSQKGACEMYGIGRAFPEELRRTLGK